MQKVTETEKKKIGDVVIIFIIGRISIEGAGPHGYAYDNRAALKARAG